MSHDTEEWCKVWRKTDSWFQKWHEEFVNFNASSGKSDNLHFDVLRLSKVYYVWAKKSTEELCVITLKNDAKFEEELTCALKKWREQFGAFWCSTQNFHVNGLLLTKVYNAWAKTVQRIYVSLYWNQCKFWRKMTCDFINDMRNLVNFTKALKDLKICALRDFFVQGI